MKKISLFILYLLVSITFTYPLILHLKDSLVGWPLDGFLYLWNIDTFWHEIFNFQNPFVTQRIFFPIGAALSLNSYAPIVSILGLPFLKNEIPFLNSLIILALPLSSFFSYLFIRKITNNETGAFIGGLFYGFNPVMFSFLISQHYYFAFASVFLPLCLLEINIYYERRKAINLVKIVLLFWLTFFTDYYTAILFGMVSVIYLGSLFLLGYKKGNILITKKDFYKALITIFTGVVIPLILLIKFVFNFDSLKNFVSYNNLYPINCSAKLKEFVIPSQLNPIIGNASNQMRELWNVPLEKDTPFYFLGWGTLIIIFFTIFNLGHFRKVVPFLILGTFLFIFSLGPKTQLFLIFSKLPFMSLVDCPQRFTLGIYLAISSIVGIVTSLFVSIKNPYRRYYLILLVVLIFLFDYGNFGLPISKIEIPMVYSQLKLLSDKRTVLEIPSGLTESKSAFGYDWSIYGLNSMQMYWQTIHQKNRVGGYVSRISDETYKYFKEKPIVSNLFYMSSVDGVWDGSNFEKDEVLGVIKDIDLGYIILSPNPRQSLFEKTVDKIFAEFIKNKTTYTDGFILYILKNVN